MIQFLRGYGGDLDDAIDAILNKFSSCIESGDNCE